LLATRESAGARIDDKLLTVRWLGHARIAQGNLAGLVTIVGVE
jgi:hypothetical protein